MEPIHILLVEDNLADVELMQEKMKQAKMFNELHVVNDGESAIQFLRNKGPYKNAPVPHLILLDLNLPRKNGMEVLAEVKADEDLKMIPIVILTSSQSEENIVRSYELQANSYVQKPVDLAGYTRIVNSIDEFWLGLVKYPPTRNAPKPSV